MTILYSSTVPGNDDGRGPIKIFVIVGPYWRMLLFVTLPLLLFIPAGCAALFPYHHPAVIALYSAVWLWCIVMLLLTALRDPGILPRIREKPDPGDRWHFNSQAETFRPPFAVFDTACNVVIENFDHTCPWTGTAIGKNNLHTFYCFVTGTQMLFYFSIFVAVAGAASLASDDWSYF